MESPNQYLYLITLSRSELLVHELHSKQCIGKITAHLSTIFAFTLLDDYLISSGEDKVLVITQIAAGSLIQKRIVNIHSTFVDMVVCGDALVGPSTSDGDMLRFVLSEVFNTKTTENYVNHYASTGMDLNYSKDLMSTNHHYCSKYLGRPFAEDFVSDPRGAVSITAMSASAAFPTRFLIRWVRADHPMLPCTTFFYQRRRIYLFSSLMLQPWNTSVPQVSSYQTPFPFQSTVSFHVFACWSSLPSALIAGSA